MISYSNPVVPGFRPDPSICRVGEDYYLVNSTFEYFPGIPLYHSRDMIHWEQIGHVLTRKSQLIPPKGNPNRWGIYAPTLRYHDGTFYLIVTNVYGNPGGNFFVTTNDINGEWSDPVYLDHKLAGIDPSLFFDDDGKVYYTGTTHGVYMAEIDIKTGKCLTEPNFDVWNGTGGNNPEGPHIYKIKGKYYLMIAEGGTELCHMVTIARADSVFGPYEECPHNPILTNRCTRLPLKAIGHADLLEDTKGQWWAICLGNRPTGYPFLHIMGRETCLVPVEWVDGWPVCGDDSHALSEFTLDRVYADEKWAARFEAEKNQVRTGGQTHIPGTDFEDDFTEKALNPSWNYIYNPVEPDYITLGEGFLSLRCAAPSIGEDTEKSILLRRQEHFKFRTVADIEIDPSEGEEAGISIYMNNKSHYEIMLTNENGEKCIKTRRQIGTLVGDEKKVAFSGNRLELMVSGDNDLYHLSYRIPGETEFTELTRGETGYLSTEAGGAFTGNYIALYASANGKESANDAKVYRFTYMSEKE